MVEDLGTNHTIERAHGVEEASAYQTTTNDAPGSLCEPSQYQVSLDI